MDGKESESESPDESDFDNTAEEDLVHNEEEMTRDSSSDDEDF